MPVILVTALPWIKALHVFSVILWMGAQLLLPILLTTHRRLPPFSAQSQLLTQIERRLIRQILNPAMLAAFLFGALLASAVIDGAWNLPQWLILKLSLVFMLAALHGKLLKQFWRTSGNRTQWTTRGYRFVQLLNFILLIAVVVLVMTKPLT